MIVIMYKTCDSLMDFLNFFNLFGSREIPNQRAIIEMRQNERICNSFTYIGGEGGGGGVNMSQDVQGHLTDHQLFCISH